ncbi:ABC transporter ATP-binding protein [Candidatus Stoquefichus massiliensis]|uniref:ABC transporter ATP-binding protein n=1 Tax=Candidatus Stoquefichus massiliensis TaxID=1470350 RepID=UPI000480C583|nr:ATP-binding cassette domain-containing protein [Candidatus Stoquefichus massiliensis]
MLEVKDLSKQYKDVLALNQVSFRLEEGIYALLGPNGSGKSTLMNLICGQLKATSGDILWNNHSIQKLGIQYYQLLGYAPQQQGLYEEMTGLRFLTYMALLKDIRQNEVKDEVQRVAGLVHMESHLYKKCRTYSGGMKQRILVAQALLGQPKLLLFDEPTAGLDPKERVSLRQVFQELSHTHILLIATHVVSDVESIAKEVIFLKQGEVVNQGSVDDLLQQYQKDFLEDVYLEVFGDDHDV